MVETNHHLRTESHDDGHAKHRAYVALLLSTALSFVVMYVVMYSMVDERADVYLNLSNVYMVGLMAGSMVPVMLLTMRGMFKDRRKNVVAWAGSVAFLATCWFALRAEAAVGDRQFMRAMIPHHSAAIQMCTESKLSDPRVKALCDGIVESQEREIAEMKALLAEKKQRLTRR